MHEDEGHRNCVVLTTRPVLAAPVPATRTCGEAAGEWASASCETEYSTLSRAAARCCGGGEVYCPAPPLCADPAAFQADAVYEFRCYSLLSAAFDESACSAAGCMVYDDGGDSGPGSCHCPAVTDAETCLATLPGELSRACVLCEVDGCMGTRDIGIAWC